MATTYANEVAGFGTTPETKTDGGIHGGRPRRFGAPFPPAPARFAPGTVGPNGPS